MGDAYNIISSIMGCFVDVFNVILTKDFWCGFSWGEIMITFLVLDMVVGFLLWLINHPQKPHEVDDGMYHGGVDAKDQDGWYKGLYAKSGESYESKWD